MTVSASAAFTGDFSTYNGAGQVFFGVGLNVPSNGVAYELHNGLLWDYSGANTLLMETDCAFSCLTGVANAKSVGTYKVTMAAGVPYLVVAFADIQPSEPNGHNGVQLSATLDPTFYSPTGTFSFSPGVITGVPEPSTWAMMLLGFGGLGFARRRSLRRAAAVQA